MPQHLSIEVTRGLIEHEDNPECWVEGMNHAAQECEPTLHDLRGVAAASFMPGSDGMAEPRVELLEMFGGSSFFGILGQQDLGEVRLQISIVATSSHESRLQVSRISVWLVLSHGAPRLSGRTGHETFLL